MPVIVWIAVPDVVRADVEPRLQQWLRFLPGWCEKVVLQWSTEQTNDRAMAVICLPEYRKVNIHIHPGYLDDSSVSRDATTLHELVHVPLEPLWDACRAILRATTEENTPLYKMSEDALRKALEGAVCDLTSGIQRLLDQPLTSNVVIG